MEARHKWRLKKSDKLCVEMKFPCPICQSIHPAPKSALSSRVTCVACAHRFYLAEIRHKDPCFVIYDLETTGLDPQYDEFIQIAAMRFTAGCLVPSETFARFAKPRRRISSFIESYTGVGNRHVANADRPEEVLLEFAKWAGDCTLIAHNGLRFDSKFLAATCQRHALQTRNIHCIDSIHMSKMLFGKVRGTGHSLDHLVSRLRIDARHIRRHDARGDVEILGLAVARMWQQLELDHAFNGVQRSQTLMPL